MKTNDMKANDEGRLQQFQVMMDQLTAMQARYKGVRGELLAKVREELMRLRPGPNGGPGGGVKVEREDRSAPPAPASSPPSASVHQLPTARASAQGPLQMLPSCRLCGRGMKLSSEGLLVCAKGHTRHVA
ncbi:MAG: hypothetical protein IT380_23040 [Myxococcales bacterium]|nr:hypothetical protein [Myxococcales bacterium]